MLVVESAQTFLGQLLLRQLLSLLHLFGDPHQPEKEAHQSRDGDHILDPVKETFHVLRLPDQIDAADVK